MLLSSSFKKVCECLQGGRMFAIVGVAHSQALVRPAPWLVANFVPEVMQPYLWWRQRRVVAAEHVNCSRSTQARRDSDRGKESTTSDSGVDKLRQLIRPQPMNKLNCTTHTFVRRAVGGAVRPVHVCATSTGPDPS